jgi:hypothetical protein
VKRRGISITRSHKPQGTIVRKKQPRNTQPLSPANSASGQGWAFVHEPDDPSREPMSKWRVRFRHNELSGQYDIEIRFRTRSGMRDTITIPARDRAEFDKSRRELCARDARLPEDRKASLKFVEALIGATPKEAIQVVSKPGFRDGAKGFVMPTRMYGTANGRFVWDDNFADPAFGEIKGDLAQYREGVLKPALGSPFLSFAILIALAAALPSYVEQRDGRGKLVPEGAIFHYAAESSAGKTLCARVGQSVSGSPEVLMDYEATARGVAEACYVRNDLVVGLDDTETAALEDRDLFHRMTLFGQRLPSGRSKTIARSAAKGGLPAMTWFCFGLSTGPETQAELAQRLGRKRHGQRVRFLELPVPCSDKGGIFARVLGEAQLDVEDAGELIKMIETAMSQNHGVLMDAWIPFLLSDDHSERVRSMVDKFVELTAGGENGLEARFARKFGVMYAAGLMAVKVGLLPWSTDWVTKVVRYCYDLARNTRDPDACAVEAGLQAIAKATRVKSRFLRHKHAMGKPPLFSESAVGLKIWGDGKASWLVCGERIGLIGVKDARIQRLVMEKAKACGYVKASKNATGSVQIRVRTRDNQVEKLRFWRLNRKALESWLDRRLAEVGE